jgi:glyoxylase-like metal-dependent hydrolase (beta-lactamase superfamily II)
LRPGLETLVYVSETQALKAEGDFGVKSLFLSFLRKGFYTDQYKPCEVFLYTKGGYIMKTNIYPIPLGADHVYIVQGKGVIMIDGGVPKKAKAFIKGINKTPIKPTDIKLLILTHGHWDHIGSAKDIKEITGAKIAMG